jgi:hypothetical protein
MNVHPPEVVQLAKASMPFGAYMHDPERYLRAHTTKALKRISAHYAARNWPEYVEAHATHDDRLFALGHVMENGGFEGEPFWLKLRDLYTRCPNPSFHQDNFLYLFTCEAAPGPWACMTKWERAVYDGLPDEIVAFRGSLPSTGAACRVPSRRRSPCASRRNGGARSTARVYRKRMSSPTSPTGVKRSCLSTRMPPSAGRLSY